MSDVLAKTWELIAGGLPYALSLAFFGLFILVGGAMVFVGIGMLLGCNDGGTNDYAYVSHDTYVAQQLYASQLAVSEWDSWARHTLRMNDVGVFALSSEDKRKAIESLIKGASDGA